MVNRKSSADPDLIVHLYEKWRVLQDRAEELRSERNANAKAMKVCTCSAQRQAGPFQ